MEHNKKTAEAELVVIGGGPAGMMCAATAAAAIWRGWSFWRR